MKLADRIAIITGGGGGIGAATARALAGEGAKVMVTDIVEADVSAVAQEVGGEAYVHDVASEGDWNRIVAEVIDKYGQVDILLNGAGVVGDLSKGAGLDTSLEEWRRIMSINLDGTFLGCKAVTPHMLSRAKGSIINISSIVSFMATAQPLAYGASKAGVQQLTRSIAWIGGQDGAKVRCNSVHPGVIRTPMSDKVISGLARARGISEQEVDQQTTSRVLFGARGEATDVASLILFLASDESSYITGSEFKVDGGWLLVNAR